MDKIQKNVEMTAEKDSGLRVISAADMFSHLSPDAQNAIIDLIKSLLSAK